MSTALVLSKAKTIPVQKTTPNACHVWLILAENYPSAEDHQCLPCVADAGRELERGQITNQNTQEVKNERVLISTRQKTNCEFPA